LEPSFSFSGTFASAGNGVDDFLPGEATLPLCKVYRELQGILTPAFPYLCSHSRSAKPFGRSNAMVTVGQKHVAVDVEHHHGSRFIQVFQVIRHPFGVQMGAAQFDGVVHKFR